MWVGCQRHTPAALPLGKRRGTHCIGCWVGPGAGLDGCRKFARTGIRSPDRPANSESLYRLSYPAHTWPPGPTLKKLIRKINNRLLVGGQDRSHLLAKNKIKAYWVAIDRQSTSQTLRKATANVCAKIWPVPGTAAHYFDGTLVYYGYVPAPFTSRSLPTSYLNYHCYFNFPLPSAFLLAAVR
jgi:hypothetical protein